MQTFSMNMGSSFVDVLLNHTVCCAAQAITPVPSKCDGEPLAI